MTRTTRITVALGIAVAALSYLTSQAVADPKTCDPAAVAAAQAAIADACPCAGTTAPDGTVTPWKNHGEYVRCVAHETAKQVATSHGTVSRYCLRTSVRCGARSTCGKPGFVACRIHDACLNDATPGDGVASGTCESDATIACDTSSDCPVLRCATRSSADLCSASGGEASEGSCCD
ncbi:MAG TPA: hypothetical protein VFD92_15675 [Candidatus Binatia bacterium]|nr:hypothetical protein [Candidatus Binatia bacterium]